MVLLSAKDYMLNELSDIFQIDRDNISKALNRWESYGLVGLQDLPGRGRKEKILADEQSKILSWVEENTPRGIKEVVQYISEKLKIDICEETARNFLKKSGYSWKRLRKSVKSQRDETDFQEAKLEIAKLEEQHNKGEIELNYFDGSGFSLSSNVPYAWQKKG